MTLEVAETRTIRGIGASVGRRRGEARLVLGPDDLSGVRVGDILVTQFTNPELVLVFDSIAALVTDQGGRSAHAAVVARELAIPAVVGTQIATQVVADGDILDVDGRSGIVRVLRRRR
jgi:phosphoenolpyruvate synthase/pyruvate phosphate dikinase